MAKELNKDRIIELQVGIIQELEQDNKQLQLENKKLKMDNENMNSLAKLVTDNMKDSIDTSRR